MTPSKEFHKLIHIIPIQFNAFDALYSAADSSLKANQVFFSFLVKKRTTLLIVTRLVSDEGKPSQYSLAE